MAIYALISLLSAMASLCLGAFVLARDTKNPLNRVFMGLSVAVAYSALCEFGLRQADGSHEAWLWMRAAFAWPLIPATFLHLSLLLSERERPLHHRATLPAVYLPAILIAAFDLSTVLISGNLHPAYWGWTYDFPRGTFAGVLAAAWTVAVLGGGVALLLRYVMESHNRRLTKQASFILLGAWIPIVAFTASVIAMPAIGLEYPNFVYAFYVAGMGFFAYAIWKHDLFAPEMLIVARETIGQMTDAFFLAGHDGRIREVNPAAMRITGLNRAQLLGKPIEQLLYFPDGRGSAGAQQIRDLMLSGTKSEMEIAVKTAFGALAPLSMSISPIRGSGEEPFGMVLIGHDLTERKWAEGQLRKAHDELEARVKERTAELEKAYNSLSVEVENRRKLESQLVQTQKMEAIGTLAGGVAHDFNNLLSAILAYCQVGQMTAKPGDQNVTYYKEIQKAADHATHLTRQLLTFSRRQVVEPRNIEMNETIAALHKMLRRLIGESIELVTLPSSESCLVRVDPGQMETVLVNMVVNARDAMPMGGRIQIEINRQTTHHGDGAQEKSTGKRYAVVSITDTGVGMSEEVRSQLFVPFFTTKAVGKGTGLGLSTCHGIVTQAGGHITVESDLGKGSTFRVYLPLVDQPSTVVDIKAGLAGSPTGTETVLLVEDDGSVREIYDRLLRRWGYKVLTASNGVEALRVCAEHQDENIDLLITDVVMPFMGGRELAEKLRETRPNTRVLFTSGYPEDSLVHSGGGTVTVATDAFIQKPYTTDAMARKVRQVLEGK
ncbi:MAG: response regulator [SAR202 cluster bacterium]|nr:response regulator [SAR202 cluster bacterium]